MTSRSSPKVHLFQEKQNHRRTGRGGEEVAAPPNFGQLGFFGQREIIWAKSVFKDVTMFIYLF